MLEIFLTINSMYIVQFKNGVDSGKYALYYSRCNAFKRIIYEGDFVDNQTNGQGWSFRIERSSAMFWPIMENALNIIQTVMYTMVIILTIKKMHNERSNEKIVVNILANIFITIFPFEGSLSIFFIIYIITIVYIIRTVIFVSSTQMFLNFKCPVSILFTI